MCAGCAQVTKSSEKRLPTSFTKPQCILPRTEDQGFAAPCDKKFFVQIPFQNQSNPAVTKRFENICDIGGSLVVHRHATCVADREGV